MKLKKIMTLRSNLTATFVKRYQLTHEIKAYASVSAYSATINKLSHQVSLVIINAIIKFLTLKECIRKEYAFPLYATVALHAKDLAVNR